jgi:uncharacterized SAM-binding protein YcdF (DUF218 family)
MTAPPPSLQPRRSRRRGTRRIVAVPLLLLTLWIAGLIWYAEDIPRAVDDAASRTDAVVVLTGGSGRLDVGFKLLTNGHASKLFISGVAREVNTDELIRLYGQGRSDLHCCVVIGHAAGDTAGNARETAQWMAQEGFASLRLVTASYHMRRSLLEFHRLMPRVTMIPHPVFPEGFRAGDWWRWPGTLNLLISEYSKFLAAWTTQAIGVRPTPAPLGESAAPKRENVQAPATPPEPAGPPALPSSAPTL